jgi:hypothetical protein
MRLLPADDMTADLVRLHARYVEHDHALVTAMPVRPFQEFVAIPLHPSRQTLSELIDDREVPEHKSSH